MRRFLGGFRNERELATACKDTDSGCSVTSDHGDEEIYEALANKISLPPRSQGGPGEGSKDPREEELPKRGPIPISRLLSALRFLLPFSVHCPTSK